MSPSKDKKTVDKIPGADIDPEIKEIFVEEAREVLATLDEYFFQWREDTANQNALTETRRAFHTLKGSGRMVEAEAIGELAWSVENMLNRVLDGRIEAGEVLLSVIADVIALVPDMVTAFEQGTLDFDQELEAALRDSATRLANGEEVALPTPPEASEEEDVDAALAEIFASEARVHLEAAGAFAAQQRDKAPFYEIPSSALQAALHTLKGSAHMAGISAIAELVTPLERFVKELLNFQVKVDDDIVDLLEDCCTYCVAVIDALQANKSADTAELEQFVARIDELRDRMLGPIIGQEESHAQVDPGFLNLLMADGIQMVLDAEETIEKWQSVGELDRAQMETMASELGELGQGAEKAGFPPMVALSAALQAVYARLMSQRGRLDDSGFAVLTAAHNDLLNMADAIAANQDLTAPADSTLQALAALNLVAGQQPEVELETSGSDDQDSEVVDLFLEEAGELLEDLEQLLHAWQDAPADDGIAEAVKRNLHTFKGGARMAGLSKVGDFSHDFESFVIDSETAVSGGDAGPVKQMLTQLDTLTSMVEAVKGGAPVEARRPASAPEPVAPAAEKETPAPVPALPEDLDLEVVALFFDEADELLEELDQSLHQWQAEVANSRYPEAIKRNLHTFKGGARMAGLMNIGDLCHDLESFVVDSEAGVLGGDGQAIATMLSRFDELSAALKATRRELGSAAAAKPAAAEVEAAAAAKIKESWSTAKILPFTGAYKGLYPLEEGPTQDVEQSTQEQVRIPAQVLDGLVNLAGESSISRSQVEQNISGFISSLDEMEATIRRMQDQVRRLGIETDAQVMFRREQIEASESVEGFDPLEMDRYSQLQQLSRGLLESASDLQDLRDTLVDKSRDAESLLLQQSRINTDLQEGLMRTRMVPFSRVVPRLRRVVRQVSGSVDKQVNLVLGNVEGELDRSVLERIMSPLEHMLRNAIDHGIEAADIRSELGKSPEGHISISFAREGGDVIIRMADDGRGLDIDAIRAKAFARGLMSEGVDYSDNEIAQFIFHSGFSTASEITQTSGRGVGMDVVNSEVRQLGGSVSMTTQRGAGTEFIVRLPFTVSVNRALMIELGEDSYALALNSIMGVTRLSVEQLTHFYRNPSEKLEYGGEVYDVRYLGTLLSGDLRPSLDTALGQLPMVLIRADNRNYAVQVDSLIGSREIVVKTLGSQFSRVPGLSGATVLGDGRVVVILDLQGLLRDQSAATVLAPLSLEEVADQKAQEQVDAEEDHIQTIMVVDDSVTVRKVTGRFLEREGFRVVTARDGVDAMRALQDLTPDLMLLDIEMPRMDGFEVARLVRSTQRLKDLPIIMITSRTGEKHRERALSMGVNRYLGKPYQEEVLIREVYGLLTTAETG